MKEQLEQNKQLEHQFASPMLDHVLPAPIARPDVPAKDVGVDQNDKEAGRMAELGSVRAMILRLASDVVTVSVFHDLGHVDTDSYEAMRQLYEDKVAFQFDSVEMLVEGMVTDDDGNYRFEVSQLANEAFDVVYHETKQKVLEAERQKTLEYMDQLNQELEPYGHMDVTVDRMLSTAPTEVASKRDLPVPVRVEVDTEPADVEKHETHSLGRRAIDIISIGLV